MPLRAAAVKRYTENLTYDALALNSTRLSCCFLPTLQEVLHQGKLLLPVRLGLGCGVGVASRAVALLWGVWWG